MHYVVLHSVNVFGYTHVALQVAIENQYTSPADIQDQSVVSICVCVYVICTYVSSYIRLFIVTPCIFLIAKYLQPFVSIHTCMYVASSYICKLLWKMCQVVYMVKRIYIYIYSYYTSLKKSCTIWYSSKATLQALASSRVIILFWLSCEDQVSITWLDNTYPASGWRAVVEWS